MKCDANSRGADGISQSVVVIISRCKYGSSSLLDQQLHQDVVAGITAANYCSMQWLNFKNARLPSAQAGLLEKLRKSGIYHSAFYLCTDF